MTRARFDKHGRSLPDTGRGCGCGLCEASDAAPYERRIDPARIAGETWSPLQRRLARLIRVHSPASF